MDIGMTTTVSVGKECKICGDELWVSADFDNADICEKCVRRCLDKFINKFGIEAIHETWR